MAKKMRALCGVLCGVMIATGCATSGTIWSQGDRTTCMVVGGLLGAAAGAAIGDSGSSESEHGIVGGALGAIIGGVAGRYFCREDLPPFARASATPASGTAPLQSVLLAVASDPDGEIAEYSWDLGDGTTATGERVNHTYTQPGSYTARLTVTDSDGLSTEAIVPVEVSPPPVAAAPRAVVRRIVLRGVSFNFDSSEIHRDSQVILQAAVEALSESADARVRVSGHTDSKGAEIYNQALSERRANAVVEYLVSLGVSRSRLDPTGAGESQPVTDNATRDGRARNRRVELEVQR